MRLTEKLRYIGSSEKITEVYKKASQTLENFPYALGVQTSRHQIQLPLSLLQMFHKLIGEITTSTC